jgi:hypothetical protein
VGKNKKYVDVAVFDKRFKEKGDANAYMYERPWQKSSVLKKHNKIYEVILS